MHIYPIRQKEMRFYDYCKYPGSESYPLQQEPQSPQDSQTESSGMAYITRQIQLEVRLILDILTLRIFRELKRNQPRKVLQNNEYKSKIIQRYYCLFLVLLQILIVLKSRFFSTCLVLGCLIKILDHFPKQKASLISNNIQIHQLLFQIFFLYGIVIHAHVLLLQ